MRLGKAPRRRIEKLLQRYETSRKRMFLRPDVTLAEVKAWQHRWRERGLDLPIVSDTAMEIAIRKIQFNDPEATDALKQQALAWLTARGFTTTID